MRGGGQRALPVVRYWLRVALDSSRPPVFEHSPGERNEQAAVPDRRRDVYGRDRFRLRGAECRRARRQEDGEDGKARQGQEGGQAQDREKSQDRQEEVRQDGQEDGQEVTRFDYRKGRACPCLFYFICDLPCFSCSLRRPRWRRNCRPSS